MKKRAVINGIITGFLLASLAAMIHLGILSINDQKKQVSRIELSETEKAQVKNIYQQEKKELKIIKDQLKTSSEELKFMLASKEKSNKEIEDKFNEYSDLKAKLFKKRFLMILKIREVIGSEKISRFDRFLNQEERERHKSFNKNQYHKDKRDQSDQSLEKR